MSSLAHRALWVGGDGLAEVTVEGRGTSASRFPVSTVKSRAGVERESILEDFLVKGNEGGAFRQAALPIKEETVARLYA